ncbi:MAG: hypothetical protein H0V78_12685 [Burkholderiales bacterium]|nr:hypothetical protein [Burkholderiales bacterium]
MPESLLLDETSRITFVELQRASGLSEAEISELVEIGVFEQSTRESVTWVFSSRCISQARTALRLRDDFELNTQGVALALTYLERIRELEERLHELECQLLK